MVERLEGKAPEVPRVTVIIPCYNQAPFLRESLLSVLEQTDQSFRVVVVDDASPDGADIREVVHDLCDPRIRLIIHDKNRGLAAARNTGIGASTTEYFACLDADDKLHPSFLERTFSAADGDQTIDCIVTDYITFGASHKRRVCRVPSATEILTQQTLCGCGVLIRKEIWEQIGGYDEAEALRYGREDWEFYINLFNAGCKAVHCPGEPLYRYRTYPGSMNLRCFRVEHKVRRYIYRKHYQLFDRAARRHTLGGGFDFASTAAIEDRRQLAAIWYSVRAICYGINRKRVRRLARAFVPDALLSRVRRTCIGTSFLLPG